MSAYRQSPFANLTPVVKNLLIINFICFIPFLLIDHSNPNGPVTTFLGAFYFNSPFFKPWQPITYMFMHGGFEHIIFNMLALFMFGPILEYAIGPKRFLQLYFIAGIGAYLLQMIVQGFEVHSMTGSFLISHPEDINTFYQYGDHAQRLYDLYHGPLVGASGAIFGVVVAFAMLYPDMEMMILFFPVPIKAKYLIPVYIIIELVSGFGQFSGDNVAHFAHIGGAIVGFIMIKLWRYR
jgi:rhomboid-like protein